MIPAHHIPERKRRRGCRGNALIEMAIGWFIITTVFGAAFEYGYIFYQYNSLFNAINNGARYASMYPYDTNSPNFSSNSNSYFQTAVQDMVLYGDPTGTSTSLVLRNLKAANISISVTGTGSYSGTPNTWVPTEVTVSVATGSNGYAIDGVFGTFTFTGKPAVTYPFVGNYTGAD